MRDDHNNDGITKQEFLLYGVAGLFWNIVLLLLAGAIDCA